jgi:hypothetical protein
LCHTVLFVVHAWQELYDHQCDQPMCDNDFDAENENVASHKENAPIVANLRAMLVAHFSEPAALATTLDGGFSV